MVFSSFPYLLLFLPIVICIYHFLRRAGYGKYCFPFLFCASLFYYGYWKLSYIGIIIFSILSNFYLGKTIEKAEQWRKPIFLFGVTLNVSLLCYFKYTDFLISTANTLFTANIPLAHIILPIGISFYTFQQIAYLSDIYKGKYTGAGESFIEYGLFVTFFPQLVAGPIVHHDEMMPQFKDEKNKGINWENMYKGLCYLSIGLAKKVLIADSLSPLVAYTFDTSQSLTFFEAGFGCLMYTFQLYFDFSGYADMAIGCALFFNIQLPCNFNSPYKAVSVQDFWRRWHMTLSRWLGRYVYVPLGGNRKGLTRTLINLFLTFLVGGIWHGAGWGFVLWGALNGIAVLVHRVWSDMLGMKMPILLAQVVTFSFIVLVRVPFRAVDFDRAQLVTEGLCGINGFSLTPAFLDMIWTSWHDTFVIGGPISINYGILLLIMSYIVFVGKNTQTLMASQAVYASKRFFAWITTLLGLSILFLLLPSYHPEFIYFQF